MFILRDAQSNWLSLDTAGGRFNIWSLLVCLHFLNYFHNTWQMAKLYSYFVWFPDLVPPFWKVVSQFLRSLNFSIILLYWNWGRKLRSIINYLEWLTANSITDSEGMTNRKPSSRYFSDLLSLLREVRPPPFHITHWTSQHSVVEDCILHCTTLH